MTSRHCGNQRNCCANRTNRHYGKRKIRCGYRGRIRAKARGCRICCRHARGCCPFPWWWSCCHPLFRNGCSRCSGSSFRCRSRNNSCVRSTKDHNSTRDRSTRSNSCRTKGCTRGHTSRGANRGTRNSHKGRTIHSNRGDNRDSSTPRCSCRRPPPRGCRGGWSARGGDSRRRACGNRPRSEVRPSAYPHRSPCNRYHPGNDGRNHSER